MKFILSTKNDFYDGWLANVLELPNNPDQSSAWRGGWKMGSETTDPLRALLPSIKQGHITIEVEQ